MPTRVPSRVLLVYGGKRCGPGQPPKRWVDQLLSNEDEMSADGDSGADLVEDADYEEHSLVEEDSVIEDNGTTSVDDGENIPLDPRRTRTTYGLRDRITLPHRYM